MLELKDFMPVNYLKKERFTGSYNGMRFCMEKAEHEGSDTMLAVVVWPEPYGYDAVSYTHLLMLLISSSLHSSGSLMCAGR